MIRSEKGETNFQGTALQLISDFTVIASGLREILVKEFDGNEELADEWIEKAIRRSKMTEEEALKDTIDGIMQKIREDIEKAAEADEDTDKPDVVDMLIEALAKSLKDMEDK